MVMFCETPKLCSLACVSYSLNSLKWGLFGGIKGDPRSLDYGSCVYSFKHLPTCLSFRTPLLVEEGANIDAVAP